MTSSKYKKVHFPLTVTVFLVVFASILLVDTICHAYLPSGLGSLEDIHFLVAPIIALFVSLLILLHFMLVKALSGKYESKELLQSKDEWEKTFNTMPDFISIHDKDFKITRVNNALCEFLDKRPEEIIEKHCYEVFHNLNEPYENCPHRKVSELDHPVSEIINDPNIGVPLQITCSPLWNDNGDFQGSLHIARVAVGIPNRKNNSGEIFPICASCKSIRDCDEQWLSLEDYFLKKHEFQFTHTICTDCRKKLYPGFVKS